jgi:hypothetical protein
MTPDPYRNAYAKALEDLTLISAKFEWLTIRKRNVENLVLALEPMFSAMEQAAPESTAHAPVQALQTPQEASEDTQEPAETATSYSYLDVPVPLPADSVGDPFQRRAKANFRFRGLSAQRSY